MGVAQAGAERSRDLSRETALYAMAMVVGGLMQLAFLPFMSVFMTAEQAGELGVLRTIAEVVAGIVVLGLPTAVIRAWHATTSHRAVLTRAVTLPVIPAVVSAGLLILVGPALAGWLRLGRPDLLWHSLGLGTAVAYLQVLMSMPRAEGLAGRYFLMQLFRGLLALGLLAGLLYLLDVDPVPGFMTARWAPAALMALFAAGMMVSRTRASRGEAAPRGLTGGILAFGLPLVPASLALIVLSSADIVMLRNIYPALSESGYYEWAGRACLLLTPLVLGFDMAWKRFIFRTRRDGGTMGELGRAGLLFMVLLDWAALVLAMSAPAIVAVVGGGAYWPAVRILPTLAGAGAMYGLYLISQTGCLLTGQTKYVAWMTGFGALLNIGFNFRLIPVAGGLGAAFATLATDLFMALSLFWLGRKVFPVSFLAVVLMVVPPVAYGPLATMGEGGRSTAVLVGTGLTALVIAGLRAGGTRLSRIVAPPRAGGTDG